MEKIDLLGNDLFLITESEGDLFSSLRGAYVRLCLLEEKRVSERKSNIEVLTKKLFDLRNKYEKLIGTDIEAKKVFISEMALELKIIEQKEREHYLDK